VAFIVEPQAGPRCTEGEVIGYDVGRCVAGFGSPERGLICRRSIVVAILVVMGLGEEREANKESRMDVVCCRYLILYSFPFLLFIAYLTHFSA
jgi:hypothetical protein